MHRNKIKYLSHQWLLILKHDGMAINNFIISDSRNVSQKYAFICIENYRAIDIYKMTK